MAPDLADLSAYLDGELSEKERRAVEDRLAADPEYAREYERLERTRTMLALAIEQPGFHARLVKRIELRRTNTKTIRVTGRHIAAMALVAAMAVVVAAILYMSIPANAPQNSPVPGPGNFAVAPVPVEPASSNDSEPMLLAAESTTPQADSTPMATTELPFTLTGTITGSSPMAIIAVKSGGTTKSGTYAPGDTIADGVTLVSVESGKAVVDYHGQSVELTQAKTSDVPVKSLSGDWLMLIAYNGNVDSPASDVVVKQDGAQLTATMDQTTVQGVLSGNTIRATVLPGENDGFEAFEVVGTFNKDWTECTGQLPAAAMGYNEDTAITFRMIRPSSVVSDMKLLSAKRRGEVEKMARILSAYEQANQKYPETLGALVPSCTPDLDAFADTDVRKVVYRCAQRPNMEQFAKYEDTDARLPVADRLVQWEQSLKTAGLGETIQAGNSLLVVDYTEPAMRFVVTAWGKILEDSQLSLEQNQGSPEIVAALQAAIRVACQENLKQLGLVVYIFKDKHEEYSPAGWLSCYPDVINDPTILWSPKDPLGTDSYIYLFPAVHLNTYAEQEFPDLSTDPQEANQKARANLPLVTNRTEFTGATPGRNVLFADGHVEYLKSETWREKVLPFVERLGK